MKSLRVVIVSMLFGTSLIVAMTQEGLAATAKPDPQGKASAQTASAATDKQPDPHSNGVLVRIMKTGAQVFYLGSQGGLDGWFILKDGQTQIAYTVPDGQHAVIGAMFMPDGNSVTPDQITGLLTVHPEIKTAMANAARRSAENERVELLADQQQSSVLSAAGLVVPPGFQSSITDEQYSQYNTIPMNLSPASAAVAKSLSPGERLYQDMESAKSVTVGNNTAAPLLFMVIDPNCPHCQATWRAIRDAVLKNALQVRLIPIGPENSDSERAAAQLLSVANPLFAWNAYVDGDKSQLAGDPAPLLVHDVVGNHIMVDDWNLNQTPIIVYRGKDGKVKIEQGEPDKVAALIGDVAPPAPPAPAPGTSAVSPVSAPGSSLEDIKAQAMHDSMAR